MKSCKCHASTQQDDCLDFVKLAKKKKNVCDTKPNCNYSHCFSSIYIHSAKSQQQSPQGTLYCTVKSIMLTHLVLTHPGVKVFCKKSQTRLAK